MSNISTINLQEIKEKLIDKLRPSGWADKLKGFIMSSDLDLIINKLYELREDGKRFTPPLKSVFRAFEECPWKELKVVIIGQDPYTHIGVADGIAFSCANTGIPQPSLQYIFNAIDKTVYKEKKQIYDPDLKAWANQGVLMLNYALTCEMEKPGTHYKIWEGFIAYVLDIINSYNRGLIFVFMGKKAQELESMIGDQHHKIFVSHPASAAYNQLEEWDSKDCFVKINDILKGQNGNDIKW